MSADMTSMEPVMKDNYTPEQRALVESVKPKPKPDRKVTNHLRRIVKESD